MALDVIKQTWDSYYNELPTHILPQIAKSACFTFTISIFLSRGETFDLRNPILKAGIAAIASMIHAVLTPMFNHILAHASLQHASLNPFAETVKSTITAVIASAVVGVGLQSSLQLSAFKMYTLISTNSINAWLSGTQTQPTPPATHNSIYLCF